MSHLIRLMLWTWLVATLAGCTPDAVVVADHETRIAALEAEVQALRSAAPETELPPAPLGEPPEDTWVLVGGVGWATNGHVLIRRDGLRPDPAAVRQRWLGGMTPEDFVTVTLVPSPSVSLTRIDTLDDAGTVVERFRRQPDGPDVFVDAAYARLLVGPIVQGAEPLGPVYAVAADGTAGAIVMPRKPPAGTAVQ